MRTSRAMVAVVACTLALAASACSITSHGPLLTGSDLTGTETTEERDLPDFTAVSVSGDAVVTIVEANATSVKVTADSGLREHISTDVNNGALAVVQDYSIIGAQPKVTVAIEVPSLEMVTLGGSSDASIGAITGDSLTVNVTGSSDVRLETNAKALEVTISGSGDVTASGSADNAHLEVSGSGELDARAITVADALVVVSGSGDVQVHAASTLIAQLSGSGNVTYWGDPTVTKTVSGSGSIGRGK